MKPRILLALGLVALVGCQTYDFTPVLPAAISQTAQATTIQFRRTKPNVMLVVDRSGSMSTQVTCANAPCPTRLQSVKTAMNAFLPANATAARFGVVRFALGGSDECAAPGLQDINVEIPNVADDNVDGLTASTTAVNSLIQSLTTDGSTPTGPTLRMLLDYPGLRDPDRDDFILLLTDGLPNCNPTNPNTCALPSACQCTRATCSGATCATGCLDDTGTISAAASLRDAGIKTIVVGFGADLNGGSAFDVLNGVSAAGGFGRPCDGNDDCNPGDTCDLTQRQCNAVKFYRAQDASELGAVLAAVRGQLGDPCVFDLLEAPTDPDMLVVRVNGQSVDRGASTWKLENNNTRIRFVGGLCSELNAATDANPVDLVFQTVQVL